MHHYDITLNFILSIHSTEFIKMHKSILKHIFS